MQLRGRVGGAEFGGEVGEVGEGQFPGVRTLGNAEVDYVLRDEVAAEMINLDQLGSDSESDEAEKKKSIGKS